LALPRLLLFFYALFTGNSRVFNIPAASLPENDVQAAAPVFGQRDARDFDFRG
jgi:hypothetical protein